MMEVRWTLALTLTVVANVVSGQPCRRLFMQGLDNTRILPSAELSGVYSLTNITLAGFAAYRHETNNEFFFYNSTLRVLVLGPLLLARTSGSRPNNGVVYPYSQVITGWRVRQPATDSYRSVSADHIRPRCVDDEPEFRRCDSGRLTFTEELTFHTDSGRTVNVTRYEQVIGHYANYRPVYKALVRNDSSVEVYLYHADGSWRLGNDYRLTASTAAFARVSDTALRPEFITGNWQLHYGGNWRSNPNLKVRCSGISSVASCNEVLCQNGGTCIEAGTRNILCSCPRGYRGSHCENRVPSCPHFGNWSANYRGWYYTEDSYEGSLTAWFCPRGSSPEFGYSVCENRFYRPSWSNRALCQSMTTTTRWTWRRTTRNRYYSRNDETDFFEDADPWLTPVVVICAVVIQVFAPFFIYCILIYWCGYRKKATNPFAKADEEEEEAISQKYTDQLTELESRTAKPENAVTISELRRIQQQLEEEVDQVRAKRRQRDRELQKTAKLSRIVSLYYYVSFWLWMIFLVIGVALKVGQYGNVFAALAVIAILCVIILPIVVLIESLWCSSERKYIKNLSSLTSATERIESIRNTQPTVCMNAECYHFELRTRTVYYTDGNGNTHSRLETYQEKVVTAFIVEPFLFTHWYDSSQSTLTDVRKVGVTKIKMELTVQFGDETTAQHFAENFDRFQDTNRYRDVYVNFFVSKVVDGFEKRLAAYTDARNKPGWIGSVWYWLATIFCLGWPYRILFNRATGRTDYNVVKVIFTNAPSTLPAPGDADRSSQPPPENAEEYIVNNVKAKIQATLDRLTAGLSKNDGDMPIKCAATDQHMNVTLREAQHTAQTAN